MAHASIPRALQIGREIADLDEATKQGQAAYTMAKHPYPKYTELTAEQHREVRFEYYTTPLYKVLHDHRLALRKELLELDFS